MEVFFNSGLIMDDCKVEGKVQVVMERFAIERIGGWRYYVGNLL